MNAVIFRPATLQDLPILLEFEQAIVEAERPFDPNLKAEGVTYYDLKELIERPDAVLIVGTNNGAIITSGYVLIKAAANHLQFTHYAYAGFMYTEPAFRGKGINRLLVDQLTNWAKAQGVFEMRLDVYAENAAALRAYEKVGFEKLLVKMRLDLRE